MKKLSLLSLMLALLLVLSFQASTLGDDVDFGGGDTGGGWDSGGWGDNGGDWDDSDSGGGYIFGGSGGGGGGSGFLTIGGGTVIIILFVIAFMLVNNKNGMFGPTQGGTPSGATRRTSRESLQELAQKDPKFSAADIEAKVKTWSIMFETAWAKGDMTSCRPFLSDGLYNTYQMQLDMMKKNGEASRTEDLAVMACNVERWTLDGANEYLDVWMQQKKRTYKVDINNPEKVVKGDKQTTYILEYRWQLMRSAGSISGNAGVRVAECPNCGAQTSMNQSGKCEYCGSTLTSESFDWVLNKVDKLAQSSHK